MCVDDVLKIVTLEEMGENLKSLVVGEPRVYILDRAPSVRDLMAVVARSFRPSKGWGITLHKKGPGGRVVEASCCLPKNSEAST